MTITEYVDKFLPEMFILERVDDGFKILNAQEWEQDEYLEDGQVYKNPIEAMEALDSELFNTDIEEDIEKFLEDEGITLPEETGKGYLEMNYTKSPYKEEIEEYLNERKNNYRDVLCNFEYMCYLFHFFKKLNKDSVNDKRLYDYYSEFFTVYLYPELITMGTIKAFPKEIEVKPEKKMELYNAYKKCVFEAFCMLRK